MFFKSGISLVITSLEREKNINKTKKKMKGNGKLFFSVNNSLEAVSLEQKSTVSFGGSGSGSAEAEVAEAALKSNASASLLVS